MKNRTPATADLNWQLDSILCKVGFIMLRPCLICQGGCVPQYLCAKGQNMVTLTLTLKAYTCFCSAACARRFPRIPAAQCRNDHACCDGQHCYLMLHTSWAGYSIPLK